MKQKLFDANRLLFDAKDILTGDPKGSLLKMVPADDTNMVPASFTTAEGITFYKEHPYQYVSDGEGERLLRTPRPRFRAATKEELEDYYRD